MKKTLLIILGTLIVLIIIGGIWYFVSNKPKNDQPMTEDQLKDWKTYKDNKYGYEIKYPNDWNIKGHDSNGIQITSNTDAVGGFIFIEPLGEYSSLDEYIKFVQNSDPPGTTVKEIKNIAIGNVRGKEVIFDNPNIPGGMPIKILIGKELIAFDYGTINISNDRVEAYQAIINQILSTFKFIETEEQKCVNDLECKEIVCSGGGFVHERCINNECILNSDAKCPN